MNRWGLTRNRRQARENACDQVAVGFSFASDGLSRWLEFFKPITERSKAKPKQFSDYFQHSIKKCTNNTHAGNKLVLTHVHKGNKPGGFLSCSKTTLAGCLVTRYTHQWTGSSSRDSDLAPLKHINYTIVWLMPVSTVRTSAWYFVDF